ncbi:protein O-mannosyl-transferase TMTC1-like [Oratosquilla oratoria]|uniref:protein O-mannosyl-transferase TMTC1-like n=1 Tax=Oratosquilla oratoria TaxID=337810 RepID=UPI003F7649E0
MKNRKRLAAAEAATFALGALRAWANSIRRLNHLLFGLHPLGFHMVNLLLHSAVCLQLTHVLLTVLQLSTAVTLAAALVFATHPVHTEAVTGLVGRADLLAAVSLLASLSTYHRAMQAACEDAAWRHVRRAAVIAALGMLAKEHAITAVGLCAAWDLICHRGHVVRFLCGVPEASTLLLPCLRRLLWIGVSGGCAVAVRLWLMQGSAPAFSDQDNPASFAPNTTTRLLTFAYLPCLNAWLLLCPWLLSHDWQMGSVPLVTSLRDFRNVSTLLLFATILLLLSTGCRRKGVSGRALLMGVAMTTVPFVPASNLFFPVGFVLAERILYIPSMGYSVLLSLGLSRLGRLRAPVLLLLLLLFSCRTLRRNVDWQSRETLFLAGLRSLPHNAKMHYNYANLQKDLGRTAQALHHYRQALRLWPDHSSAHNNLGTLLADPGEAERHFLLALQCHPRHARAFFNLARLRQKQGRVSEAVTLLEESLRHDATNRDAVATLAGLYSRAGRHLEAENLHLALLSARSSDPLVHNNYAAFLERNGRGEAALRHYETALNLDPHHPVALVNTARLMRALRNDAQAETLYKRALAVAWEDEIGESLGKLYLNTGRLDEANLAFRTVLWHRPDRLSAKIYLAQVKLQQRSFSECEDLLQEVLSFDSGNQEALLQLSLLYTNTNRSQEALAVADRASNSCVQPPTLCAHLHAHRGDLLNALHQSHEAEESYLQAVRLEKNLAHAHVNLGAIYHTKGDYVRAWRHYLAAHQQEPQNDLLLENMEKLRRAMSAGNPLTSTPSSPTATSSAAAACVTNS